MKKCLDDFKNYALQKLKLTLKIIGFCLGLMVLRYMMLDFEPCDFGYSGPGTCAEQRHKEVQDAEAKLAKAKDAESKEILAESREK